MENLKSVKPWTLFGERFGTVAWKLPKTTLVRRKFFVTEMVVAAPERPYQINNPLILLDSGRLGKATGQGCEAAIGLFSGGPRESCLVLESRRSCPRSPESGTRLG